MVLNWCLFLATAFLPQSTIALTLNGQQKVLEFDDSFGGGITAYVRKAIDAGVKLTLQATCHSYSGVVSPVNGGVALSLLQFAAMKIDRKERLVTVQPGVRFSDIIKPLKDAGLSLEVHGDYAGQTVIGAVMTGTHGYGFPTAANYVVKLKVVNGNGESRTVTPRDPFWGSWISSNGGLGVVIEMTMKLRQPFNVDVQWKFPVTLMDALAELHTNPFVAIDWNATLVPQVVGVPQAVPYSMKQVQVTAKKATSHEDWHMPRIDWVGDYMNDFSFPPFAEPKKALAKHCHQETPQVFEAAMGPGKWEDGKHVIFPMLSMDISFKPSQTQLAIEILNSMAWPRGTTFYARYIDKDIYDIPLSPYWDGPRVGIDISMMPRLDWVGGKPVAPNDPGVLQFQNDIAMLYTSLTAAGIQPRYHTGKSGFTQLPFWDQTRLARFWQAKATEDPKNIFTNKFIEMLQKQK